MIDISQNELYINHLEGIYKDYIPPTSISFCRPRIFDGFIYILGGSCRYEFADKTGFEASAGDLLYLPFGGVYRMDVRERYDFICINFYFDRDGERKPDIFKLKDPVKAESLFYRAWKNRAGASLAETMSLIYRIYNEVISSRKTTYLQGSTRAKIEDAISYISQNGIGPLTVAELADRAGMSEVYFRKLFKSVTGISPARFMIDRRISCAKELMSADYLSLEDISERCGFSSLSYFCRVFKENTGMTPNEFRQTVTADYFSKSY